MSNEMKIIDSKVWAQESRADGKRFNLGQIMKNILGMG